jgi:hypothetical protein
MKTWSWQETPATLSKIDFQVSPSFELSLTPFMILVLRLKLLMLHKNIGKKHKIHSSRRKTQEHLNSLNLLHPLPLIQSPSCLLLSSKLTALRSWVATSPLDPNTSIAKQQHLSNHHVVLQKFSQLSLNSMYANYLLSSMPTWITIISKIWPLE